MKSARSLIGVPGGHVLQQAHRVVGVENVGRSVDELGAAARQCRGLKCAAELLDFFVETADADVWVELFEATEVFVEQIALGLPHRMPNGEHTAGVALAVLRQNDGGCQNQASQREERKPFPTDCGIGRGHARRVPWLGRNVVRK